MAGPLRERIRLMIPITATAGLGIEVISTMILVFSCRVDALGIHAASALVANTTLLLDRPIHSPGGASALQQARSWVGKFSVRFYCL